MSEKKKAVCVCVCVCVGGGEDGDIIYHDSLKWRASRYHHLLKLQSMTVVV
jgi:hypothetical protein